MSDLPAGFDNWKTRSPDDDRWDEFPPVVECHRCSGEGGWDVFNFGGPEEWFICDLCNGEGVLDEGEDE